MKKLLTFAIPIAIAFGIGAEINYSTMLDRTRCCEGSDAAIEQVMQEYGFNQAWHEEITAADKVVALFN